MVPGQVELLELYDGDADFDADTDDANSPSAECRGEYVGDVDFDSYPGNDSYEDPDGNPANGPWYLYDDANGDGQPDDPSCTFPPFQTSPITFAEGANPGDPPDDFDQQYNGATYRVSPPVYYRVTDPTGTWTVENMDVSGDQEWEVFKIGLDSGSVPDADDTVASMPGGLYTWEFVGLDGFNTVYIHTEYEVSSQRARLGNTVWYDRNRDGVWAQGHERGLSGVVINLYSDHNGNGIVDGTDAYLGSQTTTDAGHYEFTELELCDYIVEVAAENFGPDGRLYGFTHTEVKFPEDGIDDHNREMPWAVHIPVTLNYPRADFGYYRPRRGGRGG
jgi:hypothetical protein